VFDDVVALLERQSPTVTDGAVVRSELAALAASTQAADRRARRRRLWRVGIPVLSIALVIGGVSTAAASPAVQGFLGTHPHVAMTLPWSPKNACVNTAYVGADTQSPTGPASAATIAAARRYVKQIDFDNIKNTNAWMVASASATASALAARQPNVYGSKAMTENFDQYLAYSTIVNQMITAKLKQAGVDTTGLIFMGGTSCHKVAH
jgi:hypothetical protein